MEKSNSLKLTTNSLIRFPRMVFGQLNLCTERLWKTYRIEKAGDYAIFRETFNPKATGGTPTVLVVGFRLKLIGSNAPLHWLFQRVCILTTPFWCGFKGFRIKLWMVDQKTKNYLGIYEWLGEGNAKVYVNFLIPVLAFFSNKNSIWHTMHPEATVGNYLKEKLVLPKQLFS